MFQFKPALQIRLALMAVLTLLLTVLAGCGGTQPAPAATPAATPAPAPAPAKVDPVHWRVTLDWAVQGPQSPFLVSLDKGFFAKEGLSIVIDRGFGSADAVAKVASGTYDIGFADINTMIEYNVKNPGKELIAIAMVYDQAPFSVMTLKKNNITKPKDLEGKTLGAPAGDAPRRLFPVFAKAAGIDASKVNWVTMDAPLRETMLVKGEVNAITGFHFTSLLNLTAAKVAEDEIVTLLYSNFGVDLYSNAVVVSPALLEKNPEAVKAFLRALTKGWQETVKNPDDAIATIKRRDSLLDEKVEKQRLMMAIQNNMLTADVKANGFGAVKAEKLAKAIDIVVEAFQLPSKPKPEQVFTDKYLPAAADRMPLK